MQGVNQSNKVCVRYKGKGKQDQVFPEKIFSGKFIRNP